MWDGKKLEEVKLSVSERRRRRSSRRESRLIPEERKGWEALLANEDPARERNPPQLASSRS